MKFLIFLAFIGLCNCEIALPEVISEAKDALEAAGNVKFLEYLKEIYGSDVVKKIEGRITGGRLAQLGQFPYQALIYMKEYSGYYLCGGSLITYRTVLTAAHCIEPFFEFNVYLGIINIKASAQYGETEIPLLYAYYHENYDESFFFNDIGLIYLPQATENILSLQHVGLVTLPNATDWMINLNGRNATVSGFGKTSDFGESSENLRYANTPILANSVCIGYFGTTVFRDTNICTSGANGVSSCSGDSGGPVTTEITPGRRVIVGIVSYGAADGCQIGYPSGNTRVTSYLTWIDTYKNSTTAPSTSPRPTTTTPHGTTQGSTKKPSSGCLIEISKRLAVILGCLFILVK